MLPWLARAEAEMRPRADDALRIRAWLSGPVALDAREGMPLDGLLSWATVLRYAGELPDDAFEGVPRGTHVDIPVPVAHVERAGHRIACASWGRPSPDAREIVRRKRKRADVEAYGLGGKVAINGGEWKSLDLPVPLVVCAYVEWYARGDRAQLAESLALVYGLGRDRARGSGTVVGWELDRVAEDRSLVADGMPARALPVRDGGEFPGAGLTMTATRAPYWRRDARTLCAVPAC